MAQHQDKDKADVLQVTHIYREGNEVVDTLANFGLSLQELTVLQNIPSFIRANFVKNKLGMPSFRFKYY